MGTPKAWLEIDGCPALRHVTDIALTACPSVLVVATPGQRLPELDPRVRRVDDPESRRLQGPLSAMAVGLELLASQDAELAYVGACDSVFLSAEHIEHMFGALESPSCSAAIPESRSRGATFLHPMCGAVRVREAYPAVVGLLRSGDRAARALYQRLEARTIAVSELPDPRIVRSCNTPETWEAAVAERAVGRSAHVDG